MAVPLFSPAHTISGIHKVTGIKFKREMGHVLVFVACYDEAVLLGQQQTISHCVDNTNDEPSVN